MLGILRAYTREGSMAGKSVILILQLAGAQGVDSCADRARAKKWETHERRPKLSRREKSLEQICRFLDTAANWAECEAQSRVGLAVASTYGGSAYEDRTRHASKKGNKMPEEPELRELPGRQWQGKTHDAKIRQL